jgi:hypothetical protein
VDNQGQQHSQLATANGLIRQQELWAGWAVRDVGQGGAVKCGVDLDTPTSA